MSIFSTESTNKSGNSTVMSMVAACLVIQGLLAPWRGCWVRQQGAEVRQWVCSQRLDLLCAPIQLVVDCSQTVAIRLAICIVPCSL